MDPYLYEDVPILKNLLDIKNEQELINIEAQILIATLVNIDSLFLEIDIFDSSSIQNIHNHLFSEIYDWAGTFRVVNIYKSEKVLNGLSVEYSNFKNIQNDLTEAYNRATKIEWNQNNHQLVEDLSRFMADLWKIHPFREGNTRAISVYMKFFAESQDLTFNEQLLSQNSGYLRNALVMASIGDYSETSYLDTIIHDALTFNTKSPSQLEKLEPNKYDSIGKYEVSDYQEMPFSIFKEIKDKK